MLPGAACVLEVEGLAGLPRVTPDPPMVLLCSAAGVFPGTARGCEDVGALSFCCRRVLEW